MLSPARGVWGWQWQLVLSKPRPSTNGGDQEGTVKASGKGSSGGGVRVVKSVHQNWFISCQSWYTKGLDSVHPVHRFV